ncbi:MAG TPA: DNA glycosylase [Nitrososphaerales archaeon]|nr:DNA glycosylase [Nitrososphaerales archaeon]
MEFTVSLDSPFSLEYTLESGQLFRWERRGEWWWGSVPGGMLRMKQEGDILRCSSSSERLDSEFVARYFRLDVDLDHVLAAISKDEITSRAVEKFYGLRLVSQDTWECLASFVLATNANIPRIKKMVSAVCSRYGGALEFEGEKRTTFPTADDLAKASEKDLLVCGLGYRAPFLKKVATSVAEGKVDFAAIAGLDYTESRKILMTELLGQKILFGVGPKVADCVLLYSCGKDQAFPIDVWITKVLATSYPSLLGPALKRRYALEGKAKLSLSDYDRISTRARAYFGTYAGYAQQYLFMAAREGSK